MALEEVLNEVRSMNEKFDSLREEVNILKESRSPRRKTPPPLQGPLTRKAGPGAIETKQQFSDEDDLAESDLVEVSGLGGDTHSTHHLVHTNRARRRTWSRYKLRSHEDTKAGPLHEVAQQFGAFLTSNDDDRLCL